MTKFFKLLLFCLLINIQTVAAQSLVVNEPIEFTQISKKLNKMEDNLKRYDAKLYMIYLRRFRENRSFEEMREEFDMDNPRINEAIDKVYTLMTFNLKI